LAGFLRSRGLFGTGRPVRADQPGEPICNGVRGRTVWAPADQVPLVAGVRQTDRRDPEAGSARPDQDAVDVDRHRRGPWRVVACSASGTAAEVGALDGHVGRFRCCCRSAAAIDRLSPTVLQASRSSARRSSAYTCSGCARTSITASSSAAATTNSLSWRTSRSARCISSLNRRTGRIRSALPVCSS
jgi:hypothetical protein